MWPTLLDRRLKAIITEGSLSVTFPDGTTRRYGNGAPPEVAVTVTDPALPRRLALTPDMALGEACMAGTLTVAGDDLPGLMGLILSSLGPASGIGWRFPILKLQRMLRRVEQFNPVHRARANVAHHYDLSGAIYDLFLDADRQYSCAYFRHSDDTLEQAQAQKKAHIARKLCLRPGMRVLDIGCGWGGMALTLARDFGAMVTGVTLSEEQHAVATRRVAEAGLSSQVDIRLVDYRHVTGQFDRIVSVGMFEHVGLPHYRAYFEKVGDLLVPDGVALIHTIGRSGIPSVTSPWIRKYIFPGGYVPALSEVMPAVQTSGLCTTDIEVWRLHYAETLRHWRARFEANIDKVRTLYDERFCRMWRHYLVVSEMAFRHSGQCVFQIQLAHRQEAVPLTRNYLYTTDTEPASAPVPLLPDPVSRAAE